MCFNTIASARPWRAKKRVERCYKNMKNKISNRDLSSARANKKDEFYTQLSDIEKELKHYKDHFKDKIVYCNCDDPRVSNFFHYFSYNFEKLGLKKLITTCYKNQDMDLFSQNNSERAIYGKKENNPETVIENILEEFKVTFERSDLSELITNAPDSKRTMDFIIPNKKNPLLIIESSYLVTTSSGQGDKSKTEISIDALLKQHYPKSKFIGFVDGIGWYVRKGDLKRMVSAYEDVFTFHEDELRRFKVLLKDTIK